MTAHPAKPLATTAPSPVRTATPSRDACRQDRPNGRSSPHLPRATSFHCSPRARTLVSQIVRAQSIVVAVEEPPSAQPRAQGTPRLCIVGTPPERSRPPGQDRSDRSCFHPRSRHRDGRRLPRPGSGACIQTGPSTWEGSARRPFRCPPVFRPVPGTTRQHMRNGTRLPCRVTARLPPASTEATLPLCGVSITGASPPRHRRPFRPPQRFPRSRWTSFDRSRW